MFGAQQRRAQKEEVLIMLVIKLCFNAHLHEEIMMAYSLRAASVHARWQYVPEK